VARLLQAATGVDDLDGCFRPTPLSLERFASSSNMRPQDPFRNYLTGPLGKRLFELLKSANRRRSRRVCRAVRTRR
jgi:hypothetical protein